MTAECYVHVLEYLCLVSLVGDEEVGLAAHCASPLAFWEGRLGSIPQWGNQECLLQYKISVTTSKVLINTNKQF